MGAPGIKTGGRSKGTPNKRTSRLPDAQAIAERLGINPLEILLHFAANNWKALGYESGTKYVPCPTGSLLVARIEVSDRVAAARSASEYLFPKRRAVELSDPEGNNPFQTFNDWVKTLVPKP